MKRLFVFIPALIFCFFSFSQIKAKNKKYPSLFWEISGNGLKKPSYLFGTMHVSSKIAFHLSDSFYVAIKNAEVVALENNPESWQEDMNKYEANNFSGYSVGQDVSSDMPDDYLNIRSLRIGKYESMLELALFIKPAIINNLLYRSYSEDGSDFEEDTYLDLYIYQTGKRLGKRVAGVEQYAESMRLMNEAFKDAAKEKNRKERSFDMDADYSPNKLQEAYRSGDLDLIDSINRINSQSDAFDEKFLYKRNEIQANSVDSILKKSSLFVGVGAAHLPGERGVIELLRKKGYRLRPIIMGARDSRHKEEIEKIRVPVSFSTQTSEDGFFKADIPGKFYRFENRLIDQQQYADMANGSYYMVTRVYTNSLFWGHSIDQVAKKIDSVLYENVPGKILSKTEIVRDSYRGFDITNRTRRGDFQRYNIFITPYEVIFFRMGGTGDYVKNGAEAKRFFSSIRLKEFKNGGWGRLQPSYGGFSIDMPGESFGRISDKVQYDAEEKTTGTHFSIFRTDIHNYSFAEEDSFDLNLMDESFASSEFISKRVSKKQLVFKGYPALDCRYQHKDGSVSLTRFLIQGPHYYSLVAHGKKENPGMQQFLNSFEIKPFVYTALSERKDSAMAYSVTTTWFPSTKREKLEMANEYTYMGEEDDNENIYLDNNTYKSRLIRNDTTGEAVYISFNRPSKYFYTKDSSDVQNNTDRIFNDDDSAWIIRSTKMSELQDKTRVFEVMASDSNSSRVIRTKSFYKDGIWFQLMTETDSLSVPSSFIKTFFENFTPADTLKGINPFSKKSKLYFENLFSADSVERNNAISSINQVELDSSDLSMLESAIHFFKWSDKNYLNRKVSFINKLGDITNSKSSELLKKIYYAAGDTIQIQQAALETLLKHCTQYAYNLFKEIIATEPPVLDHAASSYSLNAPISSFGKDIDDLSGVSNGNFLDELYDSLLLTRSILPELLTLINLDDYKWPVMRLLRVMADSNLLQLKEYETYFDKFLIEAKQTIKKQAIQEKKSAIEKAEDEKKTLKSYNFYNKGEPDKGNENLIVYATLLLPFQESKPGVETILNQLLSSGDKRLRYNTLYLLLRNKKSLPDSLLTYFAAMDEYRFELYSDLYRLKLQHKFPAAYNNHRDLARSKLLSFYDNMKPDSLIYLDSLPAAGMNKEGLTYFYKYKLKKDDSYWKLATVGLIPLAPGKFIFDDEMSNNQSPFMGRFNAEVYQNIQSGFTEFTDVKIKEDESLKEQMNKQLKKVLYSKRRSARYFYSEKPDVYDSMSVRSVGD